MVLDQPHLTHLQQQLLLEQAEKLAQLLQPYSLFIPQLVTLGLQQILLKEPIKVTKIGQFHKAEFMSYKFLVLKVEHLQVKVLEQVELK